MRSTRVGRYLLFDVLARGGMAQVHLARLVGDAGFSRVVAIKRLHEHLACDRQFVTMFLDEARLAARIRHPNVVPILDVVSLPDELFLVLEYVPGESLAMLLKRCLHLGTRPPPDVVCGIFAGLLSGLHAAHEATNEHGEPLGIVHRDVSPQNVIVGEDGFARVLDFGIAYAFERLHSTSVGSLKGKLEYMAPEQLAGKRVDRRTDVYSAGVVLWEAVTGQRLFKGDNEAHTISLITQGAITKPSEIVGDLPPALDSVVMRALSFEREQRHPSAAELTAELTRAIAPAPPDRIARWVSETAGEALAQRRKCVREIEAESKAPSVPPESVPRTVPIPVASAAAPAVTQDMPALPQPEPTMISDTVLAQPLIVRLPNVSDARRPGRLIWISLIAAAAVIGAGWYAFTAIQGDLERSLSPEQKPELDRPASPGRLIPRSSATAVAPVVVPAPTASASARPRAAVRSTTTARKKPLPPHCNPPYVIIGTGQKVTKLGCE